MWSAARLISCTIKRDSQQFQFPHRQRIFSFPIARNLLALFERLSRCPLKTTEDIFLPSFAAISALLAEGYIFRRIVISLRVQRGLCNLLFFMDLLA